jgi:hypothetical protein
VAPTFSPVPASYHAAQTVTLSDPTNGATIYYTTNGTTPTIASIKYSGPIKVSASETIRAIAVASGYTNSAVASARPLEQENLMYLRQVSSSQFGLIHPRVDLLFELIEAAP